jgi:general secretion pathway protein D
LRAVIDRLDARRAQVFIESLIAEVNADKSAEMSVQWQGPIGAASSSVIGFLGTNFFLLRINANKNIINLGAVRSPRGPGPSIPGRACQYRGRPRKFNGVYVLGFLANFIQSNGSTATSCPRPTC